MNSVTRFLIDSLAVYRGTRLLTEDTITAPLREFVAKNSHHSKLAAFFDESLDCPHCTSLQLSLVLSLARIIVPSSSKGRSLALDPLVAALATAALTSAASNLKAHLESSSSAAHPTQTSFPDL